MQILLCVRLRLTHKNDGESEEDDIAGFIEEEELEVIVEGKPVVDRNINNFVNI